MPVGMVIGLCSALFTCLVTEVYCHRCLAHRAFRVRPGAARVLDLYILVVVGTNPETWAAVHRLHHRYADTPLDPHSPRLRNPFTVLLGSPYLFAVARGRLPVDTPPGRGLAHLVVRGLLVVFWLLTIGVLQTVTLLAVHLVGYMGIMGMVNTVGHLYGRKPHPESPGYDLAWLAIPLLGHGYHNSHHAHPAAARTGFLDPVWPLLRLLAVLRLVDLDDRRAHTPSRVCCRASAPLVRGV